MVEWWLYHLWIVGDLDLETIQKMENVRIEFIRIAIVKNQNLWQMRTRKINHSGNWSWIVE